MPVLLGVKDAPISKTSQTFPTLNKIGGEPDHFLKSDTAVQCPQCEKMMYLVVQLYCPLDNSPYHRTIYIYTCTNSLCWGKSSSWQVLREQKLDESFTLPSASEPKAVESQKDVWGAGDDDWGDDDEEDGNMDDIQEINSMMGENFNLNAVQPELSSSSSSELGEEMSPEKEILKSVPHSEVEGVYMEDASILTPETFSRMSKLMASSQPMDDEQSNVHKTHLNSYYLNVFEDSSKDASSTQHVKALLENYSKKEGKTFQNMLTSVKSGQGMSGNTEDYEKDEVKHKDDSFCKFYKTVSYWPEQCIRYELGGKAEPLLPEQLQAGVCVHCGSVRQFEFQLMPALVSALTFPDSQEYAAEFGTIIIYTCSRSCWDNENTTPKSEHCIVQNEQLLLK